jgi:DNA gyrase subunit B
MRASHAVFEENPTEAKRIDRQGGPGGGAREAARKARETARKSRCRAAACPRKLADCSERDTGEDRALHRRGRLGRRLGQGPRRRTQAILPIRGKILNVEKARLHKVLSHEEILEIKAIGTGIGDQDFDIQGCATARSSS